MTSHYHVLLLAGEEDLLDVRTAVEKLAAKWMDLGITLGILKCDLDAIPSPCIISPGDCLREMLALWLKQKYKVSITFMLPHQVCLLCDQRFIVIVGHICILTKAPPAFNSSVTKTLPKGL